MPFFLSHLQNAAVRDRNDKRIGTLKDLVIEQVAAVPEVLGLVVKKASDLIYLPLKDVDRFDRQGVRLSLEEAFIPPLPLPEDKVFLVRDLLDAQVVDINGAKVVRVNDIVFSQLKDHLFVSGLDMGIWGLMRRMGWAPALAWFVKMTGVKVSEGIIPWDSIEPIEKETTKVRLSVTSDRLTRMHPADLADVIEDMGHQQRHRLFGELTNPQLADLIEESEPHMQSSILHELDPERAADILEEMEPDEAADLLGELTDEEAQSLIDRMDPEEAADVQHLLSYEEDTAGALMTTSFIAIDEELSVGDAVRWSRKELAEAEVISYFYLVKADGKLSGAVSIRRILLADAHVRMKAIASKQLVFAHAHTPAKEVVEMVTRYNLSALPVVDFNNHLIGAIAVNDVLDYLQPEK